jgi:hypothetical protein
MMQQFQLEKPIYSVEPSAGENCQFFSVVLMSDGVPSKMLKKSFSETHSILARKNALLEILSTVSLHLVKMPNVLWLALIVKKIIVMAVMLTGGNPMHKAATDRSV